MDVLSPEAARTFRVLAHSSLPRVTDLLTAALDVPRPAIQLAAAEALLARPVIAGHLELFSRLAGLPPSIHELLRRSAEILEPAFRESLMNGLPDERRIALRVIRLTDQYSQVPRLLELLQKPPGVDVEAFTETLRSLTYRLYDQLQPTADNPAAAVAAQPVHARVLDALHQAAGQLERMPLVDDVVESILILGHPQHPAVKRVLWQGSPACRETAGRLLRISRHPGVMRLVIDSLATSYPHPTVFETIRERRDVEFLATLLRRCAGRLTPLQLRNLQQIDQLDWLEPPLTSLADLPPRLQPALASFVNATRVPRTIKTAVQEWLLREGTAEGKQAATSHLTHLDEAVVQRVIEESLDSEDAEVQAWATSQLRSRDVPDAFARLVERLHSPVPEVQQAARVQLADFNTARVLALCDELSPDEARKAGRLLLEIDRDAVVKLRHEFAHPIRQRRIRTARRVAHLGLTERLVDAYVTMADDDDPMVRRTAAENLATTPLPIARRTLSRLMDDPNPRVQEIAATALGAGRDW